MKEYQPIMENLTKTQLIIVICNYNPKWKKYKGRLYAKDKETLVRMATKYANS